MTLSPVYLRVQHLQHLQCDFFNQPVLILHSNETITQTDLIALRIGHDCSSRGTLQSTQDNANPQEDMRRGRHFPSHQPLQEYRISTFWQNPIPPLNKIAEGFKKLVFHSEGYVDFLTPPITIKRQIPLCLQGYERGLRLIFNLGGHVDVL